MADIRDEDDARSRIQSRLLQGERIVWIGKPDPSVNFTRADIALVPFSLVWCGIAIAWTVGVSTISTDATPFLLGGSLFVVIGLYYVFGRFVFKRLRKLRTVYAITSERAMVLVGSRNFADVRANGVPISTRLAGNGTHLNVTFGTSSMSWFSSRNTYPNTGLDFFMFGAAQPVAFYDVADVTGLEDALTKSRQAAMRGEPNA